MTQPAVTGDDDFARAILWRAGGGVAAASLGGLLVRIGQGSPPDAGTAVGVLVLLMCGLTVFLLRTGRVRAATMTFLSLSWLLVAGISVARGASYPATLPLYLLVTLLAGLLLSTRAAMFFGLLSSVASAALIAGNEAHVFPDPEPIGIVYRAVSGVVALVVVTMTFVAALRRLQTALAELAKKNAELEATQASLEEVVEARTHSLVDARDAAEAASRTKSAFLANMSHELRTPMNAVLGMTDLLLDTKMSEEQKDMLRTIRGGGDALLAVLNDVLDMSAIEAGRLAVQRTRFDPGAAAAGVAALMQPEVSRAGLTLTVQVKSDVPVRAYGDARRVRQVLLNLVGNAVKFTEAGEISVHISKVGPMLHYAVRDTGVGINSADLERIFAPFTQIDASSTRAHGGMGLGLSISRQLAALMGGRLVVESEPRKGSTFTLEVPLLPTDPTGEIDVLPMPPIVLSPEMRILIAEDNEVNVRVLERMLASLGLSADVVGTGAAALRAVHENVYDCVLMDVHMPEMDGIEATRRIRAEIDGGGPPVVAVTADALPEQKAAFRAAGVDEVVSKPLLMDALTGALSRAAARRQKTGGVA